MQVSIYRDGCISCAACWILCPDFFEQDPEDRKSRVVEPCRTSGAPGTGRVPEDQEWCVREAAYCCTVQVITLSEGTAV